MAILACWSVITGFIYSHRLNLDLYAAPYSYPYGSCWRGVVSIALAANVKDCLIAANKISGLYVLNEIITVNLYCWPVSCYIDLMK